MSNRPDSPALQAIMQPLADALAELAATLPPEHRAAWSTVVTYISITQRILAQTNPSKIIAATKLVEMQSYIPPARLKEIEF